MTTQPDFEELLEFLEKNNVRYMIVERRSDSQQKSLWSHTR